jgi:hypothetical protein
MRQAHGITQGFAKQRMVVDDQEAGQFLASLAIAGNCSSFRIGIRRLPIIRMDSKSPARPSAETGGG